MCGICGFILPQNNKVSNNWKKNIIREMLINSSSRGNDACGIAYVNDANEISWWKTPEKPIDFVFSDLFNEATRELPNIVMAHNRAASKQMGDPKDNVNNHPVIAEESGIALIHNGLIRNNEEWRKTVGKPKGIRNEFVGEVDTEVLLRVLETFWLERDEAHESFESNIVDMCYNVEGSYTAAIMLAEQRNKIWFVRNSSPLHFAFSPKENIILFASTSEVITDSLSEQKTYLDFFHETKKPTKWIVNTTIDDYMFAIESLEDTFDIFSQKVPIGGARKKTHSISK